MKKKIPFNVNLFDHDDAAVVVTRGGQTVRVLAVDLENTFPVAARVYNDLGCEIVCQFLPDGRYKCEGDSQFDLFIEIEVEEVWCVLSVGKENAHMHYASFFKTQREAREFLPKKDSIKLSVTRLV